MLLQDLVNVEGVKLSGRKQDLRVSVHTYDGCGRNCAGCVVNLDYKKGARFSPLMSKADMDLVHSRVVEYYSWLKLTFDESRRAGEEAPELDHMSYTLRFGDHSELHPEVIADIADSFDVEARVFTSGPTDRVLRFAEAKRMSRGNFIIELVYDPAKDDPKEVTRVVGELAAEGIFAATDCLLTRHMMGRHTPQSFIDECLAELSTNHGLMTLVRYTPAASRRFGTGQVVPVDEESMWVAEVVRLAKEREIEFALQPFHERARSLDDWRRKGMLGTFDPRNAMKMTRHSLMTSLYVDHNLNLYPWAESVGNHCLDENFGFEPLGNIRDMPISELVSGNGNRLDKMVSSIVSSIVRHPKCSDCAVHLVHVYRKCHPDDGHHCYGYIPVMRAYDPSLPEI